MATHNQIYERVAVDHRKWVSHRMSHDTHNQIYERMAVDHRKWVSHRMSHDALSLVLEVGGEFGRHDTGGRAGQDDIIVCQ